MNYEAINVRGHSRKFAEHEYLSMSISSHSTEKKKWKTELEKCPTSLIMCGFIERQISSHILSVVLPNILQQRALFSKCNSFSCPSCFPDASSI